MNLASPKPLIKFLTSFVKVNRPLLGKKSNFAWRKWEKTSRRCAAIKRIRPMSIAKWRHIGNECSICEKRYRGCLMLIARVIANIAG